MLDPDRVRAFIRDSEEMNVLLNNKEQFTDDEIQMFEEEFIDEIVLTIPSLISKRENLPGPILMAGVISKLMEAEGQRENRNQMSISDDNVGQIDYSNKSDKYFNIASMYQQKAIQFAQNLAASSYYQDAWGVVNMESGDYEFYMGAGV
jgi:hypothetical protein